MCMMYVMYVMYLSYHLIYRVVLFARQRSCSVFFFAVARPVPPAVVRGVCIFKYDLGQDQTSTFCQI